MRIAIDVNGGAVPMPGTLVNLADSDGAGHFLRSIVNTFIIALITVPGFAQGGGSTAGTPAGGSATTQAQPARPAAIRSPTASARSAAHSDPSSPR